MLVQQLSLFFMLGSIFVALLLINDCVVKIMSYCSLAIVILIVCWSVSDFLSFYLPKRRVSSTNKAVLITGCTSGFGLLLAKRMCKAGFLVFAGCRKPSSDGAKDLLNSCPPGRLHIINMDVNIDEDVNKAVKEVTSKLPEGTEFWALVNNAGYARATVIEHSSMNVVYEHMEVNAIAPYRVTRAFLPLLRKWKGRVIVMSSVGSHIHFPGLVAYTMSKMGLVGFAGSLRRELRPWGIKVICLEPMLYRTRLADLNTNIKALEEDWNSAPEFLRQEYGEELMEITSQTVAKCLGMSVSNINQVVNAMHDAIVCLDYPDKPVIAPFHWRFLYWVVSFTPVQLINICLMLVIRGFFCYRK